MSEADEDIAAALERARQELLLLEPAITRRLRAVLPEGAPVRSRWNGELEVVADQRILIMKAGFRQSDGTIEVIPRVLEQEGRWRSWVHELLHAHSAGAPIHDYEAARGWEEGPVEYLQRSWRAELLRELDVTIAPSACDVDETEWDEVFGSSLYDMAFLFRELNEAEPDRLCASLLMLPIKDRYPHLLGQQMPPTTPEQRRRIAALAKVRPSLDSPKGASLG